MKLSSGQEFGNYRILNLLGRGGMGEVYLALDSHLGRNVALKVISSDTQTSPELLARFRREAGLVAILNHPNICTIYEAGEIEGQTYISMEYIEGQNLRDRIAGKSMDLEEVLDIAIQIADALDEARKKNVVHRDIKASNIVLTGRNLVKVLDFGLAKQLDDSRDPRASTAATESTATHGGGVRGTIAYMSPEQAYGKKVDHRSDIFSFGVLLYEMLTGRLPFLGASVTEVVDAILHKAPVPVARYNDSVPPDLVVVLNKMMEKDPDNRYQSVHEVWVDLRRIRDHISGKIPGVALRPKRAFLSLSTVLAVLAAVVVVLGGVYLFRSRDRTAPNVTPLKSGTTSLAVLPFHYQGTDPTRDYLGMLVTDGLIASLQPIHGIAVAPLANVQELKNSVPIADVSRELGVQWVVRGAVFAEGEDAQITAELLSTTGATAWKETLSGRPVVAVGLVAKRILDVLHLAGEAGKDTEQVRTPSVDAYRKYLEARRLQEGWDVQNNLDQAIALYSEALRSDPDFGAARAGMATALVNQFGRKHDPALLAQASEEANRAIGLDANLPEALLAFGMVQAQSGKSIEAREAFSRALELAPGDDSACRNLGDMYSSLGRNKEAREMYLKAIALRPNYWRNHYVMGTFEWQLAGNLEDAKRYLEKASELHPEGYTPLVVLGNIFLTKGNLTQAEMYFRKALERSPNPYAYNNLGLIHYYRGQYDLALRNWEAVLKESPNQPLYEANVADALHQLGKKAEADARYGNAIHGFREALKINPSDDRSRAGLAMALAAMGQCKEAVLETRGVTERHPESPELADYAAIAFIRCGEIDQSKKIALNSIATHNLLTIQFAPDLEPVRQLPEVKRALQRVQLP